MVTYPSSFTVRQLEYDDCARRGGPSLCLVISSLVVLVFLFSMSSGTRTTTTTPHGPRYDYVLGPRYDYVRTRLAAMKAAVSARMESVKKASNITTSVFDIQSRYHLDKFKETHKNNTYYLIYHAEWCGHCKKLLEKVNEICANNKDNKLIALCNEAKVDSSHLEKFPTVFKCTKDGCEEISQTALIEALLERLAGKEEEDKPTKEGEEEEIPPLNILENVEAEEEMVPSAKEYPVITAKRGWVRQNDVKRVEPDSDRLTNTTMDLRETEAFTGLFE